MSEHTTLPTPVSAAAVLRDLDTEYVRQDVVYDDIAERRRRLLDQLERGVNTLDFTKTPDKADDLFAQTELVKTYLSALSDQEKAVTTLVKTKLSKKTTEQNSDATNAVVHAFLKTVAVGHKPIIDQVNGTVIDNEVDEIESLLTEKGVVVGDGELKADPYDLPDVT